MYPHLVCFCILIVVLYQYYKCIPLNRVLILNLMVPPPHAHCAPSYLHQKLSVLYPFPFMIIKADFKKNITRSFHGWLDSTSLSEAGSDDAGKTQGRGHWIYHRHVPFWGNFVGPRIWGLVNKTTDRGGGAKKDAVVVTLLILASWVSSGDVSRSCESHFSLVVIGAPAGID
jgi:hypothetical protein